MKIKNHRELLTAHEIVKKYKIPIQFVKSVVPYVMLFLYDDKAVKKFFNEIGDDYADIFFKNLNRKKLKK